MHIVAIYGWTEDEIAVAKTIAAVQGILVYEARQRIAGGGPAVLASFADPLPAGTLAARLTRSGVPTLVIDREELRRRSQSFFVRRFVLKAKELQLESMTGEHCTIDYDTIDLLLVATCRTLAQSTVTVTERKFSLGKTLLAGGIPMSKKVTREETMSSDVRDETLWLYLRNKEVAVFSSSALNFDGLGAAMQLTRELNFTLLKNELRRRHFVMSVSATGQRWSVCSDRLSAPRLIWIWHAKSYRVLCARSPPVSQLPFRFLFEPAEKTRPGILSPAGFSLQDHASGNISFGR